MYNIVMFYNIISQLLKFCGAKIFFGDLKLFKFSVPFETVLFTIVRLSFQGSSRFYAAHAARAAFTCRKINFLVVFPHLLSRLLFAVAHSSFRNVYEVRIYECRFLRILCDARTTIIRRFYRYDIVSPYIT